MPEVLEASADAGSPRTNAAGRLLAVLDAFGPRSRALSLSEISRRSGLSLSTTHRLVHELLSWGALERDANGRYSIGVRLLELAAVHGLIVRHVSVRNQKARWGSCSRDGHICLNWRLLRMPREVRDYVMIHELMHLKRMDHSPKFWKLVARACPWYRDARAFLRNHPRV